MGTHNLMTETFLALTVSMVTVLDGVLRGFSTIALPHLELTENEGSWFAALAFTCGILLTPLGGFIAGFLGRKKTLMVISPPRFGIHVSDVGSTTELLGNH